MALIGDLFKRTLREMDQVALINGEFFGMMLPTAQLCDAARIAERMRAEFQSGNLDESLGAHLTLSFGVSEITADDDGDSLLLRARRAMESARRRGGNAVYVNDGVYSTLATEILEVLTPRTPRIEVPAMEEIAS